MNKLKMKPALTFLIMDNWKSILLSPMLISAILITVAVLYACNLFAFSVSVNDDNATIEVENIDSESIDDAIAAVHPLGNDTSMEHPLFSGIEFAYVIMTLIIGIVFVRSHFRYYIQNGIGRKTTIVMLLVYGLTLSVVTSLLVNISIPITNLIAPGITGSLAYVNGFFSNFISVITYAFLTFNLGALISMFYYRISKYWVIFFSIAIPVLGVNGMVWIPVVLFPEATEKFFQYLFTNTLFTDICFITTALVCYLLTALLIRRAPVKAPSN